MRPSSSRFNDTLVPNSYSASLIFPAHFDCRPGVDMPTSIPGMPASEAKKVLHTQDKILASFPEEERVFGKIGRSRSAFAKRTTGGYFVDFRIRRREAARYGLHTGDVQNMIQTAIGGMNITQTVEGKQRFPVNVRYPRELRDDLDKLKRILVHTPSGAQVPIIQLADIFPTTGPPMLRNEDGSKVGFVFVDVAKKDYGTYVRQAQQYILQNVDIPPGYTLA